MHHEMSKYTLAVSLLLKYTGKIVKVCVLSKIFGKQQNFYRNSIIEPCPYLACFRREDCVVSVNADHKLNKNF